MQFISKEIVAAMLPPRNDESHKGTYGHALLFAGSPGRMGAAVLSTLACLRTGAGLTTVNIPFDERHILQVTAPEAMLESRTVTPVFNKYNAIGIGPAMGTDTAAAVLLGSIINNAQCPLVCDADAITLLSAAPGLLQKIPPGTIFTPHPKEFDRLFGLHANSAARLATARAMTQKYGWVIVLKGHHTVIISPVDCLQNDTGNAGLAKGGSGDVLTGMITALLAQGLPSFEAATAGVYLHGLAADIAVAGQSPESLLATDVIAAIGKAFTAIR